MKNEEFEQIRLTGNDRKACLKKQKLPENVLFAKQQDKFNTRNFIVKNAFNSSVFLHLSIAASERQMEGNGEDTATMSHAIPTEGEGIMANDLSPETEIVFSACVSNQSKAEEISGRYQNHLISQKRLVKTARSRRNLDANDPTTFSQRRRIPMKPSVHGGSHF